MGNLHVLPRLAAQWLLRSPVETAAVTQKRIEPLSPPRLRTFHVEIVPSRIIFSKMNVVTDRKEKEEEKEKRRRREGGGGGELSSSELKKRE